MSQIRDCVLARLKARGAKIRNLLRTCRSKIEVVSQERSVHGLYRKGARKA
jgi:hypothetical protein